MSHVVVDPVTRIEGHLRIEAEVDGGEVKEAWSSSTMFRGIELILLGRDPRDAWAFTQRICGVCTTVHAIASIRAVENAIGAKPPTNARLLRNLVMAAQCVQDHVVHFYHLHALDWVDIVSALSADPAKTSELAQSISDWPLSSKNYFAGVKTRLAGFVERGQLGPFANAYWGHPAYKLPPEANLMAVAHYLEALDWQREFIRIHAILGGKNPHLQSFLVGGMATPIDPNQQASINIGTIAAMRALVAKARDFVSRVYLPDILAVAPFYKDWAGYGAGVGNYLVYGEYPENDTAKPPLYLPSGVIFDRKLQVIPFDPQKITEQVKHSWYEYDAGDDKGLHPTQGETRPRYTGPKPPYERLDTSAKYSWLKSPRYEGRPMEVGPLARMLVAYLSGHERVKALVDAVLAKLEVGPTALLSTLGRIAARGIETQVLVEKMGDWLDELTDNMGRGELAIHDNSKWDPSSWPKDATGAGFHEAPRGALGHWVHIKDGKIANYQCIVPSTWNAGPRDAQNQPGPYEAALVGTPVANPEQPLELLRTVHSFDPCMACGVHVVDTKGREVSAREGAVSAAADEEGKVPVYVWDLVVRASHWIIVATIVVLSVTGYYIGRPFVIAPGPATQIFVMGWMKVVHFYAAILFSTAVLARIIWMFVGSRYARWTQLVPTTKERLQHLIGTARFYTFLRPAPPPTIGHNALAGAAYVPVFGLYLVMIFTGFALYAVSAGVGSYMSSFGWLLPYFGGPQSTRWIHHVVMWLLLGFAVHHVYSATLMAKVEKNGTMDSIFGGYKLIPPSEIPPSEHKHA